MKIEETSTRRKITNEAAIDILDGFKVFIYSKREASAVEAAIEALELAIKVDKIKDKYLKQEAKVQEVFLAHESLSKYRKQSDKLKRLHTFFDILDEIK